MRNLLSLLLLVILLGCDESPIGSKFNEVKTQEKKELESNSINITLEYYGLTCDCLNWISPENKLIYEESRKRKNGPIPEDSLFVRIEPASMEIQNPFDLTDGNTIGYIFEFKGQFYKGKHKWISEDGIEYNTKLFRYDECKLKKQKIMNKKIFWDIMLETNKQSNGVPRTQRKLIEKKLYQLSLDELIEYDNIYRELKIHAYHDKLWAAAYIVNGGCSDDCFADFRGWLIGQGEEVYTKALADPDSLSEVDNLDNDMDWEGYGYLAFTIYEKKAGKEMPINPSLSHPSMPKGESWGEDDLNTLLPRLSEKHSW